MAKNVSVPRAEDFDDALSQLVQRRALRNGLDGRIAALKGDLASAEQQRVEIDKEIAQRAKALEAAHAKGNFFEWAGKGDGA